MATIRGSNWLVAQKPTPAGTVKSTSASFPNFFLHKWVITRGTTNTCGQCGWATRSSQNSSNAISMTAGGRSHSLAASKSLSSNIVSPDTSTRGKPPQSSPFLVFHQLRTHEPTAPLDLSSAPRLKGR